MQKLTSVHKDYFNIRFLDIDREDDGVYLYPGSYWTFSLPVLWDQDPEVINPYLSPQAQAIPDEDVGPDPELSRVDNPALPSRDITQLSSQLRVESSDLKHLAPSLEYDWKSEGALRVNPDYSLVPNMVYSLPPITEKEVDSVNPKVLAKAQSLSLHPRQEHMRLNIGKALVYGKPCSPKAKGKSSFINRVLKRL